MASVASGEWKLIALAEGEVGHEVREGPDPVEGQLRLTDLALVGPVVAEVPGPVGGVAVQPGAVDFELLVREFDQAREG